MNMEKNTHTMDAYKYRREKSEAKNHLVTSFNLKVKVNITTNYAANQMVLIEMHGEKMF